MGLDADAVVGEDAVGTDLLGQGDVRGADGDGEEGRHIAGDAEALGDFDDGLDADFVSQFQGGDVARLREGVGEGHGALPVRLVVVRSVRAVRGVKGGGSVDDNVGGLRSVFDGGRVDVRFEG